MSLRGASRADENYDFEQPRKKTFKNLNKKKGAAEID